MKFEQLNLNKYVKQAIDEMGFVELTPIQEMAIPQLKEGKDVLGQAPTGTGKTAAYAIPMVDLLDKENPNIQALIICPTRELVLQTVEEINKLIKYIEGISVVSIYGGQGINSQIKVLKERKPQIVVGTPGRLIDHLHRKTIALHHVKLLVLDECDEMLDMGFRPNVNEIVKNITNKHQTIMFSATISEPIKKIAKEYLIENYYSIYIKREENATSPIKQYYIKVNDTNKQTQLLSLIKSEQFTRMFIFCRTKRNVTKLRNNLILINVNCSYIHGNLSQKQRVEEMGAFKEGKTNILIATDIAARGIDIPNVDIVVNYELPDEDEFYLHRIGRTGRANNSGVSYTFIKRNEEKMIAVYEKLTKDKIELFTTKSKEEIIKHTSTSYLDTLKSDINSKNLDNQIEEITKQLQEDDSSILSPLQIAAALLKRATCTKDIEEMNVTNLKKGFVRYYFGLGKVDGFDKASLLSFILNSCRFLTKDSLSIDVIFDKYCLIIVKETFVPKLEEMNKKIIFEGRNVTIKADNPNNNTEKAKEFKKNNNNKRSNNNHYDRKRNDKPNYSRQRRSSKKK